MPTILTSRAPVADPVAYLASAPMDVVELHAPNGSWYITEDGRIFEL
ncbi:MAG: hypothetical protein ACJ71Z_06290 [Aeromicrobium sp.]